MSVSRAALTGLLWLGCGVAFATDDELPNMEFLEYLGMWDGPDEEWLIFNGPADPEIDKRSDPVPEGEESAEKDNEN